MNEPDTPDRPGSASGPPEATEADFAALATRLEDFLASYLEIGERLGIEADAGAVLAAVDRALAVAEGREPEAPVAADPAERQFLLDLGEELALEREGLHDHWFDDRGVEHFAPIGDGEWRRVLVLLRARVERMDGG